MASGALGRYALVGLANSIVGYSAILFFEYGMRLSSTAANALGYAVGMLLSYLLNRSFTFRSRRSHRSAIPAFVIAVAVCYSLNLAVLHALKALTTWPAALCQAAAVAAYAVSFFLVSRYSVFAGGADVNSRTLRE